MTAVAAVVLAGGRGRRMGGAIKPLLEISGQSVLDRQLAALAAADVLDVALSVAPPIDPALIEAARRRGLSLVDDASEGGGPLAGIAAALAWSPQPMLLCLAGDLPEVSGPLLALLVARAVGADAVVPRIGDLVEPLVALYGVRCQPLVEARVSAGLRRARELPAALLSTGLRVRFVEEAELRAVDPDLRSFTNWNRPADLS